MKKYITFWMTLAGLTFAMNTLAQRITVTIAGNGYSGQSGDGGPAKLASIQGSEYVCVDPSGNVYFVNGSKIRKVSYYTGVVSTYAGGGSSLSFGIPATNASLNPSNICTDPAGNLYIVSGNKIDIVDPATNTLKIFAGTGSAGYGGDGGPATAATFNSIDGICSDNTGNIYIVDGNNYRIRKVAAGTAVVTTVAGNGMSGYAGDGGPATAAQIKAQSYIGCNSLGDVYFIDDAVTYVRKITASTGIISTFAGGGSTIMDCPATATMLGGVSGMCVNAFDNVCFNETSCSCREISHITDSTQYIGGNYSTESFKDDTNSLYAWMDTQYGIYSDAEDNVYIADHGNNRIRKLILLTHTPTFAYGKGQTIVPCPGYSYYFDSLAAITDIDSGQVETWTVVTPPAVGTLTGFPASSISNGVHHTVKPVGLSYAAPATFTGADSFKVSVSDGTLSDTMTIYANVQTPYMNPIYGVSRVCVGASTTLSDTSYLPGVWSASNANASVTSAGTVTGLVAGLDTISYTLMVCPVSATAVYTVNPLPAISAITGSDTVCVGATITMSDSVTGGTWTSTSPTYFTIGATTGIVTGISYNSYTNVKYTTTNAWCSTYVIKPMTVYAPATAISGANPLCGAISTTYSTGIGGGAWTVSNSHVSVGSTGSSYATVTALSVGLDTLTYTNTNTCGTGAVSIVVTVNTLPSVGTISGPSAVCVGSSDTFTSTVSGGEWRTTYIYSDIGLVSGILTGYSTGIDTVYYTISDGLACSATAKVPVTVNTMPVVAPVTGSSTVCVGATIPMADTSAGGAWSVSGPDASVSGSGIVLGIIAGTDLVSYSVTNSCGTTSSTFPIAVAALPDAGTIAGALSVCTGATTTLTDTATGGSWSVSNANASASPSGVITGISTGSDSVIYTVANACGTTATASIVNIITVPDAGTISGETSVCMGATIALTDAVSGGLWGITNSNATVSPSGAVTGLAPGLDSIIYEVSNSCGASSAIQVVSVVDCASLGVGNQAAADGISMFPNPVTSLLNIEWNGLQSGNAGVVISDVTGRRVLTSEIINNSGSGSMQLDVSSLKEGVYLLAVSSGSNLYTEKLVISK